MKKDKETYQVTDVDISWDPFFEIIAVQFVLENKNGLPYQLRAKLFDESGEEVTDMDAAEKIVSDLKSKKCLHRSLVDYCLINHPLYANITTD